MRFKIPSFLIISAIFWLSNESEAQTARCDYSYEYFWTTGGYKNTNVSYYKCNLDTRQANYNEKLTRIDGQHGTGHTDGDVEWLANYNDNKLKTLSSIFCQKFPNLKVINMSDAEMESIDEDSLLNCKHLEHLRLSGNKILKIPESLLIKNSKLIRFWIWNNQLTTLPENLFLNQKELESLDLKENQINFLPSNIFRPLVKLEVLQLFNNKLQSINPEWFANLHNLKWLGLNGNQISEVPSKCFASLRNLERLWLYENRIKTLNSDNFDGLQNLQILGLYTNEISDLPANVFAILRNLQLLSLRNNKLTTIHSDSFGVHNQLTRVYLEDNKITAIDEKFIDNTAVSTLNMTNNICSQLLTGIRSEIKPNLKKCFDKYQPRLETNSCGRSVMPVGNIIGGTKIRRGSYPWIAALLRPNGALFCGGTLVSNRKIITAAHCIRPKGELVPLRENELTTLLGFHSLSNPTETGRVERAVQKIHVHPEWNPETYSYDADITVLILNREVVFNEYVRPICMTNSDLNIAAMTEGIVVGNGKGGKHNEHEDIPKILKMPIQSNQECYEKDDVFKQLSTGRTFCAGSGNGEGVCSGDSGSGFVVKTSSAYYLRGIVSVSPAAHMLVCDVNSYSVFTDALKFIDWINGVAIETTATTTTTTTTERSF